jgi:hypothetical protein
MTQPEVVQAVAYYKQGYTCTQSILSSFATVMDFRRSSFQDGRTFWAGTSCTNDMWVGGRSNPGAGLTVRFARCDDDAARYRTYQFVNELIQRFKVSRFDPVWRFAWV